MSALSTDFPPINLSLVGRPEDFVTIKECFEKVAEAWKAMTSELAEVAETETEQRFNITNTHMQTIADSTIQAYKLGGTQTTIETVEEYYAKEKADRHRQRIASRGSSKNAK